MTLFQECIDKLKNHKVLTESETIKYFELLQESFVFTSWGKIDWTSIQNKKELREITNIVTLIQSENQNITNNSEFTILWDNGALPAIKVPLASIQGALEDIVAVSFDTWIFSDEHSLVIEFYHEGTITLGQS